jgi:hypothetical protein
LIGKGAEKHEKKPQGKPIEDLRAFSTALPEMTSREKRQIVFHTKPVLFRQVLESNPGLLSPPR